MPFAVTPLQISKPCKISEIIKAVRQSDFALAIHLYAMTYERVVSRCVEWPSNATAGISRHGACTGTPGWNTSAISMASEYFTARPAETGSLVAEDEVGSAYASDILFERRSRTRERLFAD